MSALLKRKLLNYGIFVLGTYLLECVSFAFMGWGFFPIYFALDLVILLIIGAPTFFFKNTLFDRIYLSIFLVLFAFLFVLNAEYYIATGTIFSIQDFQFIFKGAGVVGGALSLVNVPVLVTEIILVVLLLFGIIFINTYFKIKPKEFKNKHKTILVVSVVSMLLALTLYPVSLYLTSSYDKTVNNNPTANQVNLSKNINYRRLGMLSYYLKDIDCMYFTHNAYSPEEIKEYCLNHKPAVNDFTGSLKDYNILTIMIETGAEPMINEAIAPNLCGILKDGINCIHNYSKNKTQISEYLGIVGNYTTNGVSPKANYAVPFSLPNVLKDYNSFFCHDVGHGNDIYGRHQLIPKLGFKDTYFHDYLFPGTSEWGWGNFSLDSEAADKVVEIIKSYPKNQPFYGFYTSLTMHGPYIKSDSNRKYLNKLEEKYGPKLKEIKESKAWVNPLKDTIDESCMDTYMLKVMDFDVALGKIIDCLKDDGRLDNTLLVLYGDHDIYFPGKSGKHLSMAINKTNDIRQIKLYKTILNFYNPTLNNSYKTKYGNNEFPHFSSPNSIVPTILDLLGKPYTTGVYLGDSIFNVNSDNDQLFYSFEFGAYLNEHYYSQTNSTIEKTFDDNNSQETFKVACTDLMNKLLRIISIYTDNIFKKCDYNEFIPK